MTQDEMIKLAKQAGFERLGVYAQFGDDWVGFTEELEAFAKLVAQHEREACANVCEDYGRSEEMQAIGNDFAEQIRAKGQA